MEITPPSLWSEMNFNRALSDAFRLNAETMGHVVLPLDTVVGRGSTDMGNVSQVVPSTHPFWKVGGSHLTLHNKEFQQAAGTGESQRYLMDGAKMLAMTATDVWTDSDPLSRARDEFSRSLR